MSDFKPGAKPMTQVNIVKVKKGNPTVLDVFGFTYVLQHPSQRPGAQKKGAKK